MWPAGDTDEAEAVISLCHGEKANKALAVLAVSFDKPCILPDVVACHILHQQYSARPADLTVLSANSDTRDFLRAAAVTCHKYGWKKVIVIALEQHYWRSVMTARRLGLEVTTVDVSSIPYDGIRHRLHFLYHELVARLYYWWKNWI